MDGIETLENIKKSNPEIIVIMISGISKESTELTLKALKLGALDFIKKPEGNSAEESIKLLEDSIRPLIKAIIRIFEKVKNIEPTTNSAAAKKIDSTVEKKQILKQITKSTIPKNIEDEKVKLRLTQEANSKLKNHFFCGKLPNPRADILEKFKPNSDFFLSLSLARINSLIGGYRIHTISNAPRRVADSFIGTTIRRTDKTGAPGEGT